MEEYYHLVEDLSNKLMTKIIRRICVEEKKGHGFKLGNLFITFRVYK